MLPMEQVPFQLQNEDHQIFDELDREGRVISLSYGLALIAAFIFSHGIVIIEIWAAYAARARIGNRILLTTFLVLTLDFHILLGSAKGAKSKLSLDFWILVALVVPILQDNLRALILLILALVGIFAFMPSLQEVA
ncbi:CIC11C00000001078 [Sungouiella intermedia]|uniref:CIC11C00000001078 n=1 Tax=Sungouiella intermedia TaxID=45354 RepID=A0A1L0D8R0_9ASCO|nr:CIC11C00000001078 [[Candida] intermedia]